MTLTKITKKLYCSHNDIELYEVEKEYSNDNEKWVFYEYEIGNNTFTSEDKAIGLFIKMVSNSNDKLRKTKKQTKEQKNPYYPDNWKPSLSPASIKKGGKIILIHNNQELQLTCLSSNWCGIKLRLTNFDKGYHLSCPEVEILLERQYLETIDFKIYRLWTHVSWSEKLINKLNELLEIQGEK